MKYTIHLLAAILFNTGEEQVGEHEDRETALGDTDAVIIAWLEYADLSVVTNCRMTRYIWHSWSVSLSFRLKVLVTLYRYYTHRPIATHIDGLRQVLGRKGCSRNVTQKWYVKLLLSSDAPLVQLMRIECFAFKTQLGCRHWIRICSEIGYLHQGIILVFHKRLKSSDDGVDILALLRFVETSQYTLVLRCGFKGSVTVHGE